MLAVLMSEGHDHAEEASSVWGEFVALFSDPAHVMAEFSWEIITALMLVPLIKFLWTRWTVRHDAEVHHTHAHEDLPEFSDPEFQRWLVDRWKKEKASGEVDPDTLQGMNRG